MPNDNNSNNENDRLIDFLREFAEGLGFEITSKDKPLDARTLRRLRSRGETRGWIALKIRKSTKQKLKAEKPLNESYDDLLNQMLLLWKFANSKGVLLDFSEKGLGSKIEKG